MPECIACGGDISEDEGVFGQGTPDEAAVTELADGETKDVDDVFAFDDGPYCGIDCLMEAPDD